MPEIVFKDKEYVYNHHLTVPYRPLVADTAKGIGAPALDGNLPTRWTATSCCATASGCA